MKIISNFGKDSLRFKKVFLAIGVFDGVHLGHQALIKKVIAKAKSVGGTSAVMTFDPHPVQVLHPTKAFPLLVTLPHRLKLIEELGADVCLVIRFTKKFSRLKPEEFIQNFLIKHVHPQEIFVGDDFRFGQNRSGDLALFRSVAWKYHFKVNKTRAVRWQGEKISSTKIRQLIADGNITEASQLLGHSVSILGRVVKGESRGKKLGFPTANIEYHSEVIPPRGVYLVHVIIKCNRLPALANIGVRPTFKRKQEKNMKLEVHILDFNQDIYQREIVVEFVKKIRDERRFISADQLIEQIKLDEKSARSYFMKPPSRGTS